MHRDRGLRRRPRSRPSPPHEVPGWRPHAGRRGHSTDPATAAARTGPGSKRAIEGALAVGACAEARALRGSRASPGQPRRAEAAPAPPARREGQAMCRTLDPSAGVESVSRCPLGPGGCRDVQLPGQAACLRDS